MKQHAQLLIIGLVVIIISAAIAYALTTGDAAAPPPHTSTNNPAHTTETPAPSTPKTTPVKGAYIAYSDQAFADHATARRILFFHADWCPQCRALDASLRSGGVPDGTIIYKLNYDTNQSLRSRYTVTLQTTFVEVDTTGAKVKSYVAYDTPTRNAVIGAFGL